MTIIALFLFLVPFIGLCAVILAIGIADIFGKRENKKSGDLTSAQSLHQEGNAGGDSL